MGRAAGGQSRRQISQNDEPIEDACGLGPDLELPPELTMMLAKKKKTENEKTSEEKEETFIDSCFSMLIKIVRRLNLMSRIHQSRLYQNTVEFIHEVDAHSRQLFPLAFLVFNLAYWVGYIYIL